MIKSSFYILLFFLSAGLILLGLRTGSFQTGIDTIGESLFNYNHENKLHYIIINLRLPRLLLAFLVGGALSLSGYLMQAMLNNPLAEPYILGTSSGASLGTNIVYLGMIPAGYFSVLLPSLGAFSGAMIVTLMAIAIAYHKGQILPAKLLLAGIALSSLMISVVSFLLFIAEDDKLKSIIYWSLGSFERARWEFIPLLGSALLLCAGVFTFMNKNLNIMLLGESRAHSLGLNIRKLRWIILTATSLLTGLAVATSGPIGFVGLIIPHLTRAMFGFHGKYNIINCILLGGVFMLGCDVISRLVLQPSGMPIGIITSFLGIPFFVYLLFKRNYNFS
jgi:iron complex transport system permease protein